MYMGLFMYICGDEVGRIGLERDRGWGWWWDSRWDRG